MHEFIVARPPCQRVNKSRLREPWASQYTTPMDDKPRSYYSQRTGKGPTELQLTLSEALAHFERTYRSFDDQGFFQEYLGKDCPDGREPVGKYGGDVGGALLLRLKKRDLWPIWKIADKYGEDDLFDMIEFLFDNCSKPAGQPDYHSWNNCGNHYYAFDRKAGQAEFRQAINQVIGYYGEGYEL